MVTNTKYYNNKEAFIEQMNLPKYIGENYDSCEPNSIGRLIYLHESYVEDGKEVKYSFDRGLWLCLIRMILENQILTDEQLEKVAEEVSNFKYR